MNLVPRRLSLASLIGWGTLLLSASAVTPRPVACASGMTVGTRCSCVSKASVARSVEGADLVAVVTLDTAFVSHADSVRQDFVAVLRVERAWRWPDATPAPPARVDVFLEDHTTCAGGVWPGERHLVVARRRGPRGLLQLDGMCSKVGGPIDMDGAFRDRIRRMQGDTAAARWTRGRAAVLDTLTQVMGPARQPAP